MKKKDNTNDVRVLVLKRWNLPQTKPIYDEKNTNHYGEYVSFQSHHFIDILPADMSDLDAIPSAYREIKKSRARQFNSNMRDLHTVQSMTILGKNKEFWETKSDVLYITFIQLTNESERNLDQMESQIHEIMKICTSKDNKPLWTLYFSLDFCDYVLFTKNISMKEYHDVLWHLGLFRKEICKGIRDTFTMYCIREDYLIDSFKKFDSKEKVEWNENFTLSINLSIQDVEKWRKLERFLNKEKIQYDIFRASGRYDLNLCINCISGSKLLRLLRCIDKLCCNNKDTVFGGYELAIMAPRWDGDIVKSQIARQDRRFEKLAVKMMGNLCDKYCEVFPNAGGYVQETKASLEALLKNGFSEEFVLSVFQSFVAFLRISLDAENQPIACKQLEVMNRNYFTALNTLALCTMHNERQFIQAPSFNATYFDVPPKLLAYYSAIVNHVARVLQHKEPIYRFVISPDYREDIFVNPMIIPRNNKPKEHLAVICLGEAYFYDPPKAIALLCHELGHYLSNRQRQRRAKSIFRMVSFSLLMCSPLFSSASSIVNIQSGHSLLNALVDSLEILMIKEYEDWSRKVEVYPYYHLISITEFLNEYESGFSFLGEDELLCQLKEFWTTSIESAVQRDNICRNELKRWIRYLEDLLHGQFINEETADVVGTKSKQIISVLVADALSRAKQFVPEMSLFHAELCDEIIGSYSEAYADLRMAELLGDSINLGDYEQLLCSISNPMYISSGIRHDSLCRVLWNNEKTDEWCNEGDQRTQLILKTVVNHVSEYLSVCHMQPCLSSKVEDAVKVFKEKDVVTQFETIHHEIVEFRSGLIRFCKTTYNN